MPYPKDKQNAPKIPVRKQSEDTSTELQQEASSQQNLDYINYSVAASSSIISDCESSYDDSSYSSHDDFGGCVFDF